MIYNSLQLGIFTTMIGFVTWPPFLYHRLYKGGHVIKPIIVVITPGYKLLYIINIQVKESSWPYLISNVLVFMAIATMLLLIGYSQAVFV